MGARIDIPPRGTSRLAEDIRVDDLMAMGSGGGGGGSESVATIGEGEALSEPVPMAAFAYPASDALEWDWL